MNLVRFRQRTKDLHLPDGRVVKVTINEQQTAQTVEELDGRQHATVRPRPVGLTREGKVRQAFQYDDEFRLWAPVPADANPESIEVVGRTTL